ncbi:MAG: potassium transporter TrkA [Chloroflexaceae bacterium]|nr:potassium transporter TrkA [Chloroflexaceae bacterium]
MHNGSHSPRPPINLTPKATTLERLRAERENLSRRRWLKAQWYDLRQLVKESQVPLIGLLVLLVMGGFYFRFIYADYEPGQAPYGLSESFFATFMTMTGEPVIDFPSDMLGRILFFILPVLGLIFVIQSAFEFGRKLLDKNDRIADWQVALASTIKNHVIICGLGRVSYRVVLQLLDAGEDVVVIEMDTANELLPIMYELNVPVIYGDARTGKTLQQAGLERARGLISAVNNDLLNIEIGLAARRFYPDMRVVMRIFDERLDQRIEASNFGHNSAFSSSSISAPTFAAAAVSKGVRTVLPIKEGLIGIAELEVTAGGRLETLVYRIEQDFNVQVIGYMSRNGTWSMRPTGVMGLYPGDRILLMGTLPRLAEAWRHSRSRSEIWETLGLDAPQIITPNYNRVIVCGVGRVGYRMVRVLSQMKPRPEIVVITDHATNFTHEIEDQGIQLIYGSAAEEDVLQAAGIERAYSVVAATSDHLTNLKIGLEVRRIRPDVHLVVRVFNDEVAGQLEGMFGDHSAFSSSTLAAPTMAAAALLDNNAYAIALGEKLLATATVQILPDSEFVGKSIRMIREKSGIIVVAIHRYNEHALAPSAEQVIAVGDKLLLLAGVSQIAELRATGAKAAIFQIEGTWKAAPQAELSLVPNATIPAAPRSATALPIGGTRPLQLLPESEDD